MWVGLKRCLSLAWGGRAKGECRESKSRMKGRRLVDEMVLSAAHAAGEEVGSEGMVRMRGWVMVALKKAVHTCGHRWVQFAVSNAEGRWAMAAGAQRPGTALIQVLGGTAAFNTQLGGSAPRALSAAAAAHLPPGCGTLRLSEVLGAVGLHLLGLSLHIVEGSQDGLQVVACAGRGTGVADGRVGQRAAKQAGALVQRARQTTGSHRRAMNGMKGALPASSELATHR